MPTAPGERSGQKTCGHEPAKGHLTGDHGVLHRDQRAGQEHQRQDAQDERKGIHPKEGADGGRKEKQERVERGGDQQAYVEHRGQVGFVHVLFLDQGGIKPALHKDLGDGDEHRQHRQNPVVRRVQQPRENDADHKGNPLRAHALG